MILVSGFVDADYAGFLDTSRSLIRYMFFFCGSTVIWKANPEHMVSLSTTEAEFIAVAEAIKEATRDSYEVEDKTGLLQRCFGMVEWDSFGHGSCYHERTKHIR